MRSGIILTSSTSRYRRTGLPPLGGLTKSLNTHFNTHFTEEELKIVLKETGGERFLIIGDKVRAQYGHTVDIVIPREPVTPPASLFHGSLTTNFTHIRKEGLIKFNHIYVFLATTPQIAYEMGNRKGEAEILTILSGIAHEEGQIFYQLTPTIFGTTTVSPKYIQFP